MTLKLTRFSKERRGSSNTRRNSCRNVSNVRIFSYGASNRKRFESSCILPLAYQKKKHRVDSKL